jgi:FtsP/CotA-like multicopper oxidase with cupredoxin domain
MIPEGIDVTPDSSAKTFDRFLLVLAAMALLTVGLALVAAIRGPAAGGDGAAAGPVEAGVVEAHIELSEFAIAGDLAIPAGDVTIEVMNTGGQIHNLAFENGAVSADVNGGDTARFDAGSLTPGTYTIFCAIPGHREAGMEAHLVVGGADTAAENGARDNGGRDELTPEEMDRLMMESMLAFPAETEGKGTQVLEPTEIRSDGTKVFHLTASLIDWEVAPGQIVEAWAYNDQVPGPWIQLDVGDNVEIVVTNETPLSTDVHFHGLSLPNAMDGVAPYTQDPIVPGGTFTYVFEAEEPALGMYHAHMHGVLTVPNGLFAPISIGDTPLPRGMMVSGVEIPDDLEIAQEIPMVLNDAGTIGLTLNAKSFPATEPYVATEGDWLVYHYFNEGLQIHPMHQHQFFQLVFAKDGVPLDQPYWVDTLNVAPGERYSVLVHADRPGTWVWHCHILNHVERDDGMFGMVTALIVEEAGGA